jgi:hypothetical protein
LCPRRSSKKFNEFHRSLKKFKEVNYLTEDSTEKTKVNKQVKMETTLAESWSFLEDELGEFEKVCEELAKGEFKLLAGKCFKVGSW